MIYISAIILLVLFYITGECVVDKLSIPENARKHSLVFGFIFYMSFFFALTAVMLIINVSWGIYFTVMTLYSLGVIIYASVDYIKNKRYKNIDIKQWLMGSWPALLVIIAITVSYLFTVTSQFIIQSHALSVGIDNHVYMSKALQGVNQAKIFQNQHDTVFFGGEASIVNLVGFWEYFWAYGASVFGQNVLSFAHTTIPFIIYTVVVLGIDEVFFLLSKKADKKLRSAFKYGVLMLLPLLIIEGYARETIKFFFFPWFGNVTVTMLYLPIMIIFFYHAMRDERWILFLFFLPFVFTGFNPTSMIMTWFYYPIFLFVWYNFKQYKSKHEKFILYSFIGLIVLFLFASLIQGRYSHYWYKIPDIFVKGNEWNDTELAIFIDALQSRMPFVIVALLTYAYRIAKKKSGSMEQFLMGGMFALLVLSCFPYLRIIPFNLFNFSYTRLMNVITMSMYFYSCLSLIMLLKMLPSKVVWLMVLSISLLLSIGRPIIQLEWIDVFDTNALFNQERVNKSALGIANSLKEIDGIKNVCIYPDTLAQDRIYETRYTDLTMVMMGTDTDSYLTGCFNDSMTGFIETNANYIISWDEDKQFDTYIKDNLEFVTAFDDESLSLKLYKIIDKSV